MQGGQHVNCLVESLPRRQPRAVGTRADKVSEPAEGREPRRPAGPAIPRRLGGRAGEVIKAGLKGNQGLKGHGSLLQFGSDKNPS